MNHEIDALQLTVSRMLVPFLWLQIAFAVFAAILSGNGWLAPGIAAFLVAAITTALWRYAPEQKATRVTVGVALIAMVSIIVAACRGAEMQIDIHMYYFASLAILAAYCDRDVLLAAAGVTAVHHLLLNFVAPALVFPNGADFLRVVLHAVIVVAETAALVWMVGQIVRLFQVSAENVQKAQQAALAVEAASERAEAERGVAERERAERERGQQETARQQSEVMAALAKGLAQIAAGRLAQRLETNFPPQYERVRQDFNAAMEALHGTIAALVENTRHIGTSVQEISSASDDLARRTSEQTRILGQAASALDGVTGSIRRTAEGAGHARAIVLAARGDTELSGTVVAEAVEAMGGIDASSRQIGQIIGVIDEIAFQTNLLALNAGVEAARAGDAGRGFAVVATEVRALAQRSADAAKQIKELVRASEVQVKAGVDRVGRTGDVLSRLAAQVTEIDDVIAEISATTKEQATTLAQVNDAVGHMDRNTQQNAAMVEQSNAAAHQLVEMVQHLASQASRFEIGTQPAAPQMPRALPAMRRQALLADS